METNDDFFFTDISILYRKFQAFINLELENKEVHSSELPYLIVLLFIEDGILQDDFTHITKIDKAATSRALKSLENKKYIYRKESAHSNRHKQVFALPKAFEVKDDIIKAIKKWSEISFAGISTDEKAILLKSLKTMATQASNGNASI